MEMDEATRRRARSQPPGLSTSKLRKSPGSKVVLLVSVCLYVASLCLPAVAVPGDDPIGLVMLLSGVFGFTIGEFRWIANVFYLAGLVLAGFNRKARIAAV